MDKVRRGDAAQMLLNDPQFVVFMAELEGQYIAAWKATTQIECREDAHRYVKLIEKFKEHLQSIANTGDITKKQQQDLDGVRKGWF